MPDALDGLRARVLCAWGALGAGVEDPRGLAVVRVHAGLINDTFFLGEGWVLQRLHPVFGAEVHRDIEALTSVLADRGVPVPRLVRTATGALWHEVTAGPEATRGIWRLLTRQAGETHHRAPGVAHVISVAGLLGRFHSALVDLHHDFAFAREGAHDTAQHMARMEAAVEAGEAHRLHRDVAQLAAEVRASWEPLAREAPSLPPRLIHGDPKISNFLFRGGTAEACAVIDLDTMAWSTLDVELGDALRSWCNRATEDADPCFDASFFEAAVGSWLDVCRGWVTSDEVRALAWGLQRICLELTARFARDTLEESYFGWDPDVAPTRGDHNLVRARAQMDLARQVIGTRSELEAFLRQRARGLQV